MRVFCERLVTVNSEIWLPLTGKPMTNNQVFFFDTTLRDGEQSPGCSMTTQEKLTMAHALEEVGVDIIEAGFAMASEGDFAAISTITQAIRKPRIASLARASKEDIEIAARALQFVRSKAAEWNIDKARIGASGGSAGACSSLWLAFHDDLADPKSSDPVARESTRLWCAAVTVAQTTLDPQQMKEWTPNSKYGGHAFGFAGNKEKKLSSFDVFLAKRDTILPWIAEYSPYALVTADDPPVYLFYGTPPALGQDQKDPTHTSNFGVKLQEKCRSVGVECELFYPGAPDVKHKTVQEYLIERLKAEKQTQKAEAK